MPPSGSNARPPLVPKLSGDKSSPSSSRDNFAGPARPCELPKRKSVLAACVSCREFRVKCNAERPTCNTCIKRNLQCRYVTQPSETHHVALRRKNQELEQSLATAEAHISTLESLYQALRSRSEADVVELVSKLRAGKSLSEIIDRIGSADLLLQLRLKPEQRFRFEVPWQPQWPTYLQEPWNPYLASSIYGGTLAIDKDPSASQDSMGSAQGQEIQYLTPFAAASIADSRIDNAKISVWTTVCSEDKLLRQILSAYLKLEYDWSGMCFHIDDFLSDLLKESGNYCSSLLVNVILALGCHCLPGLSDRADYWNPSTLAYKFLAEAKRLWEISQHGERSLCTLQAAILMFAIHVANGLDAIGKQYLERAVVIAQELRLFDTPPLKTDRSVHRSAAVTAWGLYWAQSMMASIFMWKPLIKRPPKYVLPDPVQSPCWYGELSLRYPTTQALVSMHQPSVFKAKMEMMKIVNDMTSDLHKLIALGLNAPELRYEQALSYATRCQEWFEALPMELSAHRIFTPTHFKLHLHFHETMMRLDTRLRTVPLVLNPHSLTTRACQTAQRSPVMYDTLIRLQYLRHGFEESNTYISQALSFFAFMVNNRLQEVRQGAITGDIESVTVMRSSLLLAAKGLYEQSHSWSLAADIFRVLYKAMNDEDRLLVGRYVATQPRKGPLQEDKVRLAQSHFPLDILKPTDNTDEHRIKNLIRDDANE